MEDLCTLAKLNSDDLSTHAVSIAAVVWALQDAYVRRLDRAAFHRAADLALALYVEERKRNESLECSAPLLDTVYWKAFIAQENSAEELSGLSEAIAGRFHAEILRLLNG